MIDRKALKGPPVAKPTSALGNETFTIVFSILENPGSTSRNYPVDFLCHFRAIFRFGSLGGWANANGWQIFLWLGTRSDNPQIFISIYDRFFSKLSRNMVGDIFVSLIITGWFFLKLFTTWIRFRFKGP